MKINIRMFITGASYDRKPTYYGGIVRHTWLSDLRHNYYGCSFKI